MAPCGSCGGNRVRNDYEITYKHDNSTETVTDLAQVRVKLAKSPAGGTYRAVPKKVTAK